MPRQKRDLKKELKQLDYFTLIIMTVLVAYSLISIGNAMAPAAAGDESFWQRLWSLRSVSYVRLQAMWFLSGLALMAAVIFAADYSLYAKYIWWPYGIVLILLAVLLIMEMTTRGAASWFRVGSERGLQPSEFAKIILIVMLAGMLSRHEGKITKITQVILPLMAFAVPFALILLQPDLGTALVFIVILAAMLFVAGINWKLMALGICGAATAVPLAIQYVLNDDQRARLNGFFGIQTEAEQSVYQLQKSQVAIGSGQMHGKGLLAPGSLSQLDYVPDQHTDFIFSAMAEAFGFIGVMILLALYVLLLARLIYMAWRVREKTGQLIITGVAAMLAFHIFQNIGMTVGIMPITGIPLPFMSYGGSSLWTNMIAVALALNVYSRRDPLVYETKHSGMWGMAYKPKRDKYSLGM
ncbi:MAG: rod shape-determining protein RodA [Christensenellales bacterium]|jgi:rod shape determining protein RodA